MNYDYFYIMRLGGRGLIKEKLAYEKKWNFLGANSKTLENVLKLKTNKF
jgi:hypothetical protein